MTKVIYIIMISFASCLNYLMVAAAELDDLIEEIVATIPPEDLLEDGNPALANALQELVGVDLGLGEEAEQQLRLRAVGAWLALGELQQAREVLMAVIRQPVNPAIGQQSGLLMIELWQAQLDAGEAVSEQPLEFLAAEEFFHPGVQGRAWLIEAQRQLQQEQLTASIAACDAALGLLSEDLRARIPAVQWRIAAMEAQGLSPRQIDDWLRASGDEAARALLVQRQEQTIIGRPMPELQGKELASGKHIDINNYVGRPIVVFFFASWARNADAASRLMAQLNQQRDDLAFIGVTLDTADTIHNLPVYRDAHQLAFPVLGQQQGWDGDWDQQWYVTSIPQAVLIDANGVIAAQALPLADMEQLTAAIETSLSAPKTEPEVIIQMEQPQQPADAGMVP